MSTIENVWPADSCDGISIWTPGGDVSITGTDDEQIKLESDVEEQFPRPDVGQIAGRWLLIRLFGRRPDEGEFALHLPKDKKWVVQLSAARGDVSISDIQARLRVDLQRGDVQVENCQGIFTIAAGQGDIKLERCAEMEMPELPPQPDGSLDFRIPPFPEGTVNVGPGRHWRWDNAEDWATWGMEVANQARNWGQQFRQIFGSVGWISQKDGVSLHVGHGDANLETVETSACAIRLGSGDTTIEDGWIASLQVKTGRGDIQCDSVMPAREWAIETAHGDINLSLPANAQARLDVATRHGSIHSDVPLVRVGRPGPEARYGGRMVGTMGKSDADTAEISLVAMHGDIQVDVESAPSPYTGKQAFQYTPAQPAAAPAVGATVTESAAAEQTAPAMEHAGTSEQSTEMAILQSLSEGKISAAEAEQLLRNLGV
jgi:hypothetical protein